MGKLVEWGMPEPTESEACSKCKMNLADTKDCCKKDQQKVKIEKSQKAEFSFEFKSYPSVILIPLLAEKGSIPVQKTVSGDNNSHGPPRTQKTPVFLLVRNFRI
jgi:hypothetical protein